MCRFVLYLGTEITVASLVTEPAHSIIHQSVRSRESREPLNGDGFGLAWYVPDLSGEPAIFKDITPAWNNLNLLNLARVTRSSCVLAHVRAATPGLPVIQLNCHPFSWGPFAFMHNGRVAGFPRVKRAILGRLSDEAFGMIRGSTDTEHVFALFVDRVREAGHVRGDADGMARALQRTIQDVEDLTQQAGVAEPSLLNLAVTDGEAAVASRYVSEGTDDANSLYVQRGTRYVCEHGECAMRGAGTGRGTVMIASEPLSAEEGWEKVPRNHMVVVQPDGSCELRPLTAERGVAA